MKGVNDNFEPACTAGCFFGWGWVGGVAALVLFILFGVFALVPAGPFAERSLTLGVVLVVLGVTGVASLGGFFAVGIPCACFGFMMDKAMDCGTITV